MTISKFQIFWKSTGPDKKTEAGTHPGLHFPIFFDLVSSSSSTISEIQLSHLGHTTIFTLVICQNEVFLLTTDFTAESLFKVELPNLCQIIPCNGIHIITFQLNIKYLLKSFSDMGPCNDIGMSAISKTSRLLCQSHIVTLTTSKRSSRVTKPDIPPYSSSRMAIWFFG